MAQRLKETNLSSQSTEILLVALGGNSNKIRAQLVILPLGFFFKVHWSKSYFILISCRSVFLSPKCSTKYQSSFPRLAGLLIISEHTQCLVQAGPGTGWGTPATVLLAPHCSANQLLQLLKGTPYALIPR